MHIEAKEEIEQKSNEKEFFTNRNYLGRMIKNIHEVESIKLEILKRDPLVLVISCQGVVTSGGWTNGQLIPFVYMMPPTDGIYEFDFVATEPSEEATPELTGIRAETFFWESFPTDLGGVKIYAMSNMLVEELYANR